MKRKELDQSRIKLRALLWMVMATCIVFTGCMRWGQPLLSRAVIQYDSNVLKSDKELLLLNIIRMHDDQPPHFTAASNITATFTFGSTGGITPSWSNGDAKNTLGLSLTATSSNSPTITIAPMQGKDFAQRLLKPIDIAFANMLILQEEQQISKMLRLIGHSFFMVNPKDAKETFEMIQLNDGEWIVEYPIKHLEKRGCFTTEKREGCILVNRPRIKPTEDNLDGFTGDIKSVDIATKTIVVAEGEAEKTEAEKTKEKKTEEEKAFVIGDKTKIFVDGKYISFADLKKRENEKISVYIEYKKKKEEGKVIAYRITKDTDPYKLYRQLLLHIKAVQLSGRLQFFPLCFDIPVEGTLRTAKDLSTKDLKDTIDALEKLYRLEDPAKSVTGKTGEQGVQKNKPGTEEEGFILTSESGNDVNDTFMAADDLKGKDMKYTVDALGGQYHWKDISRPSKKKETFILTKRCAITALTDFDFEKMEEEAKIRLLNKIFKDLELSDYIKLDQGVIIVLFRGDEENRWPIYGLFRLRNFKQVLQFLAESLKGDPGHETEYNVAPSRLTKEFLEKVDEGEGKYGRLDNPPLTLHVSFSPRTVLMPLPALPDRLVDTDYNGELFWVSSPQDQTDANSQFKGWENIHPLRWDKQVFDMLYEIFQMNRVEPSAPPPLISIPK